VQRFNFNLVRQSFLLLRRCEPTARHLLSHILEQFHRLREGNSIENEFATEIGNCGRAVIKLAD
jgi:hypothetical protein